MARLDFIILFLLISCIHLSVQSRASYGELCDKSLRCESRSSLTCTNGTCVCVKEDEMTFDKERNKCVVLSGERCSYTAVEVQTDGQDKQWTEKLDCIEHSSCTGEGYCECNESYFEHSNGTCVPKKLHGDNCRDLKECRSDKHLICLNGTCLCDETEATFESPLYRQCVAKPGNDCNKYGRCITGAYCNSSKVCECNTDYYYPDSKGSCSPLKSYGEDCEGPEECRSDLYLICLNGKCSCNETDSVFESNYGRCVAKVGGEGDCKKYKKCPLNSNCDYYERRNDYRYISNPSAHAVVCQCHSGFIKNGEGRCWGVLGSTCNPVSSPCSDDIPCINGKCQCHFPNQEGSGSGPCYSKLGGQCEAIIDGKLFKYKCLGFNSECRNDTGIPECLCKSGYIQSGKSLLVPDSDSAVEFEMACLGTYGTACASEESCDSKAGGLVCYNGTCSCPNSQEYDNKLMKCRGLVGAQCKDTTSDFCIEGAYCELYRAPQDKPLNYFGGSCRCKLPRQVDINTRKCVTVNEEQPGIEKMAADSNAGRTEENKI